MRIIVLLSVLACSTASHAQTAPDTWWVQFTDKAGTPYSLSEPEAFLSPRAIQRRAVQGIVLDELDLPVDPAYTEAVLALGGIELVNRSRWFNAITIRTSDTTLLDLIEGLPFVQDVKSTRSVRMPVRVLDKFRPLPWPAAKGGGEGDYGVSFTQIAMMNGHLLHELDAKGQGMLIGVLDSGFEGTDVLPAFDALRDRDGILFSRDMVTHDGDVFADHWHGRSVLSCMAGMVEGQLIGTAPLADYVLVRTEDVGSEFVVEEDHWVSGAEFCDSLGVDILNTSLGYTVFDWTDQDHAQADMDGATARISIACGIASAKGMVPVTSAGNLGESEWGTISAPADAVDILAVGAVGAEGQYAPFSSRGPSADGRVKPDVAAMGWGTMGLGPEGTEVVPINGTSFSAPLVAGLVACLWQLHPDRTAHDVMDAVRRSASQFAMPGDTLGYGIPDIMLAHRLLELTAGLEDGERAGLHAYPVPFDDHVELRISGLGEGPFEAAILDMAGRQVWQQQGMSLAGRPVLLQGRSLADLPDGAYVLRIRTTRSVHAGRVLKQAR